MTTKHLIVQDYFAAAAAATASLYAAEAAACGLEGGSTTEAVRSTVANILGLIPVCPPSCSIE